MSIDTYPPQNTQATIQRTDTIPTIWRNQTTGAVIQAGWAPAQTTSFDAWWLIPSQYAGGDLTFLLLRQGGATGTAVMTWQIYLGRNNAALTSIAGPTSISFTPGDTLDHLLTFTLTAGTFQAGDYLRIIISRDGDNASDTMAAGAYYDGFSVTYSAYVMGYAAYPASVNNASYEEGTFTVTATGFSGTAPSGTVAYARTGKQVTLRFPQLTGTSNATTFTLTGMPSALWPTVTGSAYIAVRVVDNGTILAGSLLVSAGGTMTLNPLTASTAWTASGVKTLDVCAVAYLL